MKAYDFTHASGSIDRRKALLWAYQHEQVVWKQAFDTGYPAVGVCSAYAVNGVKAGKALILQVGFCPETIAGFALHQVPGWLPGHAFIFAGVRVV
jgi:hypothetical protein